MNFQMNNDIKAVLYSKEQIDEVARDLGERITKDFEGKNPLVICVLKGAVYGGYRSSNRHLLRT